MNSKSAVPFSAMKITSLVCMAMYLACEINLTLCMCVPDPLWPKYLSRHCPVSASHSLAERSVIKQVGGYYMKIQMQYNARLLLQLYIESPHYLICCYVIVIIECRESAEVWSQIIFYREPQGNQFHYCHMFSS